MSYSIDFNVDKAMDKLLAPMERGLRALTIDGAGLVQEEHRNSPATGRIYKRGNVIHQASSPGEAPAVDTGRLIGSIFGGEIERNRDVILSRIVANTEYAEALENPSEKGRARPFIVPPIARNWDSRLMPIFGAASR